MGADGCGERAEDGRIGWARRADFAHRCLAGGRDRASARQCAGRRGASGSGAGAGFCRGGQFGGRPDPGRGRAVFGRGRYRGIRAGSQGGGAVAWRAVPSGGDAGKAGGGAAVRGGAGGGAGTCAGGPSAAGGGPGATGPAGLSGPVSHFVHQRPGGHAAPPNWRDTGPSGRTAHAPLPRGH